MNKRFLCLTVAAAIVLGQTLCGCARIMPAPADVIAPETKDTVRAETYDECDDDPEGSNAEEGNNAARTDTDSELPRKYDNLVEAPNGELIPEGWELPLEEGFGRGAHAPLPSERFLHDGIAHQTPVYTNEPYGITVSFEAPYFRRTWSVVEPSHVMYDSNICYFDSNYPGVSDHPIMIRVKVDEEQFIENSGNRELDCGDDLVGYVNTDGVMEYYVTEKHLWGYPHIEISVEYYQGNDLTDFNDFINENLTVTIRDTSESGMYPPRFTDGYGSIRYPQSFPFDGVTLTPQPERGRFFVSSYKGDGKDIVGKYMLDIDANYFRYGDWSSCRNYYRGQKSCMVSCENNGVTYTARIRRAENFEHETLLEDWETRGLTVENVMIAGYNAKSCSLFDPMSVLKSDGYGEHIYYSGGEDIVYLININGQRNGLVCSVTADSENADEVFAEGLMETFLRNTVFYNDDTVFIGKTEIID